LINLDGQPASLVPSHLVEPDAMLAFANRRNSLQHAELRFRPSLQAGQKKFNSRPVAPI
jgi:hypothetical protein